MSTLLQWFGRKVFIPERHDGSPEIIAISVELDINGF